LYWRTEAYADEFDNPENIYDFVLVIGIKIPTVFSKDHVIIKGITHDTVYGWEVSLWQ
jgi:hypothetical protein